MQVNGENLDSYVNLQTTAETVVYWTIGGYVLFAVYTAELASRVRERFAEHPHRRHITIDTVAISGQSRKNPLHHGGLNCNTGCCINGGG